MTREVTRAAARGSAGRLEQARREHALAVFREWLERTDDPGEAARRAGVSARTGRRWRGQLASAGAPAARGGAARGPTTRFVGRRHELEALHRVVREGRAVVAILGMGGVGKTRLALRYAELFGRERFAGGVYVAALGGARTVDDVCRVVAAALGLERGADQPIATALAARGPALLVLDDLDGCAPGAAPLIERWAAAAPATTVLMTARARPGIGGETSFELDALPVEPDGVDLFIDRARLVRPDFSPEPEELRLTAEVVRRLDGLPLAIELAAARVGLLGLAELHVRLHVRDDDRFALLSGAGRGHPSLRAALERSWDVLGEADRRALAECSVFRGGFTLAAAERVLSDARVVDRIQTLRDHSLLRTAGTGRRGEPRFDMYESIRELARERLADPAAVHARHAAYFLEVDPDPADLDNLRAVHRRALAGAPVTPARAAAALRALIALHPLLARTGPLGEYRASLDATLVHADAAGLDPALRARAYAARGRVLRGLGELGASRADAARALELARAAGAPAIEAQVRRDLGRLAHTGGSPDEAREHYEAARALFAARGDVRAEAHVWSLLSDVAHGQSRDADAQACGERAVALFGRLGDPDSRARARYAEGAVCFRAARYDEARRCWEEAIELLRGLGDHRFEGYARCNLGILLCEVGRYHTARIELETAHQIFHRSGYSRLATIVSGYLGTLEHRLGDLEAARARYRDALAALDPEGARYHAGVFRACLASALAQLGRADEAQAELERAGELLEALADPKALAAYALHRHVVAVGIAVGVAVGGGASAEAVGRAVAALAELPPASLGSDDVRLARDLLARQTGAPAAMPRGAAWWISEDGTAFRGPGTHVVDLRARRPLSRLLAALAQHHVDAPGAALSTDALFDRAWPGERALPEARVNRVNVALVTLRKLGLRPLLLRTPAGYRLDPHVAVELAPDAAALAG